MRILITGSSGLIGTALATELERDGHTLSHLVRSPSPSDASHIPWEPLGETLIDPGPLEGLDGVIHLAGENINGRWTDQKKAAIRESRVNGTQLLARSLARCKAPPSLLLSASAIGIYGDTGDRVVTESAPTGTGFLAEVCRDWEGATREAEQAGIRVVNLRTGVVLDPNRGALKEMLGPFRAGLGGPIGKGNQYMSWIALADVVGAVRFMLELHDVTGPINLVSPGAVTNRDFTRTLGSAISRPTLLPLPGFVARILFGEMAEDTILASTRVRPAALLEYGFRFQYPTLQGALDALLHPSPEDV